MPAPALKSARLTRGGVVLGYTGNGSVTLRRVPPDGALTVPQAALVLKLRAPRLYAMLESGEITKRQRSNPALIPVAEVRRLARKLGRKAA